MPNKAEKFRVDFWVEARAKSNPTPFFPKEVSNATGLYLKDTFWRLIELAIDGKLKLKKIDSGKEWVFFNGDAIPYFSFTPEYINFINERGAKTYDLC
jgi:hypothetical protein